MDVLSQSKMPRPEGSIGTVISRELLKSTSLSGYSHEKSVPYSEDFISFSMSRQEGMDLSGPWSQSGSCLRNGRSPVIPSLVTEGSITNPIIYRPENVVFPVDDGSPLTAHEQTAKQRFAYYDSSPGKHSAIASGIVMPVAIRKHPVGPVSISPPMPNPVGLAVPKPVYGHSPCCSELGCMTGPRYVVDRGSQKIPSHVYEDEWMAQYGHLSYLHKKEQEASMQKKALQVEHSGERVPLKDVTTEGYHGMGTNGHKRVSSFIEPNHRSHPCSSPRSFMAPSSEHCQRFQNPSKIYKPLPTSHPPVYEPVTIAHHGITQKVYHDHPHVPKYSQIPQHSMFYYPHNNMDVCRDEHPPHIPHSPQSPPEQCHIPQPVFSDLPNPYPVTPRSHAFVSNFPGYHAHRMHLNASRMKSPSDRPCPPLPTQHSDRPLDFSMPRAHMVGAPKGASGQPGAFQPRQSKANFGSHSHPAVQRYSSNCSDWRGSDSPVRNNQEGFGGAKHTDEISNKQTSKNTPLANAESSSKRKSEGNSHVYELKTVSKIQKRENGEGTDVCQIAPSPPMPVINNVFSLAPYKAYLEAAGMLPTATGAKGGEQQNHSNKLKQESVIHNRSHKQNLDEHEKGLKQQSKAAGEVLETVMIKKEKIDQQEILCHEREDKNHNELGNCIKNGRIKEEPEESEEHIVADTMFPQIVIKGDYEAEKKSLSPEKSERLTDCKIEPTIMPSREYSSSPRAVNKLSPLTATHAPETSSPPQLPETKFFHQKIPPHCLKLSACNIVMPDNLRASAPRVKQVPQSPGEIKPSTGKSSRQARHQFMELHQSLCRLISRCISKTPQQELRTWMSCMDLGEPVSPSAKAPKISCLLGSKAREMWLKDEETVMALQKVLIQLETYVGSCECPFPHVIRAGAVFIPMLVVKEVLFPQVQGSFIDQVLQEHRVELRPTTLSEERHLMQLQRRACSSKLRKLLSLKHLPDIYPDVLNLHYHDCVSKLLGLELDLTVKREHLDDTHNAVNMPGTSSSSSIPDARSWRKDLKTSSCLRRHKRKSHKKERMKRMFLEKDDLPAEEELTEESENWSIVNSHGEEEWEDANGKNSKVKTREESWEIQEEPEDSWGCPLTSDDLSSGNSDTETESSSSTSYQSCLWGSSNETQSQLTGHSGMILKLRKVFHSKGQKGRGTHHYQAVTDVSDDQRGSTRDKNTDQRQDGKKRHNVSRHGGRLRARVFSPALHSSNLRRSFAQIKYCSYLSTCHSTDHRRRWVLRSAVQTARRTMKNRYPDLVGKRIRHLYEEKDKTEVWYKGVVLRIHEPHPNPLKTVFEVKYDSEPEWQYYLELLVDYKKGWLKVED